MNFNNEKFDASTLLAQAVEAGIINPDLLQQQIEMKKRQSYLSMHAEEHTIWQGSDGWWNTYIPDDEKGRKRIKKRTKSEVEDIIVGCYKRIEVNPSIREVYDEWMQHKFELRKIQANTMDRYNSIFERHFGPVEKVRVADLTPYDYEEFLEKQIVDFNLTHKGFSNLKGLCKGFLLWAKKKGYITWNVSEMFGDMDVSDRQFKKNYKEDDEEVYDDEETEKLIKHLCDHPDKTNIAILLLYLTGMRVGEVVVLRKTDVRKNMIRVRHTESRVSKGNANLEEMDPEGLVDGGTHYYYVKESPKSNAGNRNVLVPEDFMCIIDKLMDDSESPFLFTGEDGQRITTNVVRRRLTRLNNQLKIKQKSPHKLRKTYATILLDNNLDRNLITALMGHTDIAVTEGHYHRDRKNQEQKSAIVSNLIEFKASTFGLDSEAK